MIGGPPGRVRVELSGVTPGVLCYSAACQAADPPVVAVRVLAFPPWLPALRHPNAAFAIPLWRESWGKSYPMCAGDIERTLAVLRPACEEAGVRVDVAGWEER